MDARGVLEMDVDAYLQKRVAERGKAFRPFELATDYRLGGYTPRGGTRRK